MPTKTLDVERLARELGVRPPPLPLSDKGQEIAALLSESPEDIPAGMDSDIRLTPTREKLLINLRWSLGYSWPSRTGPVDRLTYNAVVRTAIAANSLIVGYVALYAG